MILIVSNREDLTSDFVVKELSNRGLPFARLNTDEFPAFGLGIVSFGFDDLPRKLIRWNNRIDPLDFNRVRAILYRRPVAPVPDETIEEPGIRRFCTDESYDFLRGLWLSLPCHWMSHPEAIRKAEHKIYQLNIAQSLSFVVPKTVITNDPSEVMGLFESCVHGIVIKPLYLGFIDSPSGRQCIFTTIVSPSDLKDSESIRVVPSIFQERILKRYDVRVTIVGERIFAAKIEAHSLPSNIPDWRFLPIQDLKHEKHRLPVDVENACFELVTRLDLDFGAIDLGVDEEGNYVFFEINPNGQWAWLETVLGFRISGAIVDRLTAKSRS